ncbi:MAG: carbohydrate ABC transporter permease [Clostridia bacterium]|nr:carbohydrate ABC transporter permease [Clostridia bacterium]
MKARRKFDKSMILPFIICTVYALTLVYPFVYLLIGSFNTPLNFISDPLGIPKEFQLQNFKDVLFRLDEITYDENLSLAKMFLNSITLSVGLTLISMALQSMGAYVLAKYDFRGNKAIYLTIIIASMIPTVGSLPATMRLMTSAHLTNTYIGMLCLQSGAFGGCFLYLHAYFKSISWSYAEVAMIDGASDFSVFTRIMVPLAGKAIKTYGIICFLGFWNDYWLPSLFYNEHPTLAVGLTYIQTYATSQANYPLLFAAMITIIVPVLILFACFQKQLLGSVAEGGLKE